MLESSRMSFEPFLAHYARLRPASHCCRERWKAAQPEKVWKETQKMTWLQAVWGFDRSTQNFLPERIWLHRNDGDQPVTKRSQHVLSLTRQTWFRTVHLCSCGFIVCNENFTSATSELVNLQKLWKTTFSLDSSDWLPLVLQCLQLIA